MEPGTITYGVYLGRFEPDEYQLEIDEGLLETDKEELETQKGDFDPDEDEFQLDEDEFEPDKDEFESDKGEVEPERGKLECDNGELERAHNEDGTTGIWGKPAFIVVWAGQPPSANHPIFNHPVALQSPIQSSQPIDQFCVFRCFCHCRGPINFLPHRGVLPFLVDAPGNLSATRAPASEPLWRPTD